MLIPAKTIERKPKLLKPEKNYWIEKVINFKKYPKRIQNSIMTFEKVSSLKMRFCLIQNLIFSTEFGFPFLICYNSKDSQNGIQISRLDNVKLIWCKILVLKC